MNLVMTVAGQILLALASTLSGTSSVPFMTGARLKLVNSSSVTLNQNTTWGSVSASIGGYDGYGDGTLTFNTPAIEQGGTVVALSNTVVFRPTDSTNPQNIFGAVITDPGSASVIMAGPFTGGAVPMTSALSFLQITVPFAPTAAVILATLS